MVNPRNQIFSKSATVMDLAKKARRPRKSAYDMCSEQLSAFNGVLPLIKF